MEFFTRQPRSCEMPVLRQIWQTVFGEDDISADIFFSHYFDPELCVVADHAGVPAAAGYLFPAGKLVCGGQEHGIQCAMIYALATLPEYRGHGFGSAISRELIRAGHEKGIHAVVLHPSSDSLFEYYSSRTSLRDCFYVCEQKFSVAPSGKPSKLSEIDAEQYAALRKKLLADIPHIEMNLSALNYQQMLCRRLGGGLFAIDIPDGPACATVETSLGGTVWIKELLTPVGSEALAISSIAAAYPAKEYIVRTPACRGDADSVAVRFGMLAAFAEVPGIRDGNSAPWYGLAFD